MWDVVSLLGFVVAAGSLEWESVVEPKCIDLQHGSTWESEHWAAIDKELLFFWKRGDGYVLDPSERLDIDVPPAAPEPGIACTVHCGCMDTCTNQSFESRASLSLRTYDEACFVELVASNHHPDDRHDTAGRTRRLCRPTCLECDVRWQCSASTFIFHVFVYD